MSSIRCFFTSFFIALYFVSVFLQLGCNPEAEAHKRRMEANYQVQPHLMAVGHAKSIGKMFLSIEDGKLLELSRSATPTNAVDLLLKTYFALHVFFPLGWKNAFRFIQIYGYGIPLENARESSFSEPYLRIMNTAL